MEANTLNSSTITSMEQELSAIKSLQASGTTLQKVSQTRESTVAIMQAYLAQLNLDTSSLSVIHVAGTKGKGSTCAMVEAICRANGYKTGLFTSPHLISICERFRINGRPISNDLFVTHFNAVWTSLKSLKDPLVPSTPGFFRFLTLVAFRLFLAEEVDVLILEVGLGGRLDATNVIQKPVVCAVTTLDLDHTAVLGDTIEKIAYEKAGIFKPGVPVFTVPTQEPNALEVLKTQAQEHNASSFNVVSHNLLPVNTTLSLHGDFQRTNASLALALASEWKRHKDGTDAASITEKDLQALSTVSWPGRAQKLVDGHSRTFYLDGAHTQKSIECCVSWFKESVPKSNKLSLMFYCSHDRDVANVILPLVSSSIEWDQVILCPVDNARPSNIRVPTAAEVLVKGGFDHVTAVDDATTTEAVVVDHQSLHWQLVLKQVWKSLEAHYSQRSAFIQILPSIKDAIKSIQSDDSSSILITGSLYLVGDSLKALNFEI